MPPRTRLIKEETGGAAVEFAVLLPVWFMLFFGLLDYGWYLTNLMVLENAVATGARAGVKVKYWLDENDPDFKNPMTVAQQTVQASFWISKNLKRAQIQAVLLDDENQEVTDLSDPYAYLQVKIIGYPYEPLTGYLPENLIPQKIGAFAMTVFP